MAIALRLVLTLAVSYVLMVPGLRFVGAILLVGIACKLLQDEDGTTEGTAPITTRLRTAVARIAVADLVMSLDNVVAIAGISGAVRGRHRTTTTRRSAEAPRHPDLVKRGWHVPSAPDQLWVADFSYVWTLAGFVYVAFVVDVYSRRILGWRAATSMRTFLVTDALRQAIDVRHRAGTRWEHGKLVHHSDAGSQYTSVALTAELLEAGIAGSIGTVGDALDNALCESTIGLFKTEAINDGGPTWKNHAEVEWQVARWVHWYNHDRLHSSIGHLPPVEFERSHRQATTVTPTPEVA